MACSKLHDNYSSSSLLFISLFVQFFALAYQINQLFLADNKVIMPFLCIWSTLCSIGNFLKTAPAVQIKYLQAHKISTYTLLLTLLPPSIVKIQNHNNIIWICMDFFLLNLLSISSTV